VSVNSESLPGLRLELRLELRIELCELRELYLRFNSLLTSFASFLVFSFWAFSFENMVLNELHIILEEQKKIIFHL
jgi:hypothetical protein